MFIIVRLSIASFLVLLASCGSSVPPVPVYPAVKPLANATPTAAGKISIGIVREIPGHKVVKTKPIGTPFMNAGNQKAVPETLKAPVGKVFIIIAFLDPPLTSVVKMDISIQSGSEVLLPDYECQKFYPQPANTEFEWFHSFRPAKTKRIRFTQPPPFAVAFEVDAQKTRNGTLVIDGLKTPIEWK